MLLTLKKECSGLRAHLTSLFCVDTSGADFQTIVYDFETLFNSHCGYFFVQIIQTFVIFFHQAIGATFAAMIGAGMLVRSIYLL